VQNAGIVGEGRRVKIDQKLIVKILCVALVAAVMLPVGRMLFPHVSEVMSGLQFQTLEAVVSTTLGFGISALLG
jgi:hypothetical protein